MIYDLQRGPALRLALALALVALIGALRTTLVGGEAVACGAYPWMLLVAEEKAAVAAPVVSLMDTLEELEVIERPEPSSTRWRDAEARTAEADRNELRQVLVDLPVPIARRERLLRSHWHFRQAVLQHVLEVRGWEDRTRYWWRTEPPPPRPQANLPRGPRRGSGGRRALVSPHPRAVRGGFYRRARPGSRRPRMAGSDRAEPGPSGARARTLRAPGGRR